MSTKQSQIIYEFPNFLNRDECSQYITMICEKQADKFTESGDFTNKKWVNQDLASKFWDRTREFTGDNKPLGLAANNLIMAGIYYPGNSFAIHTDTGLYFNNTENTKTQYTMLIYLNDDFEGGDTIFYDTDTWEVTRVVKPETGKALVFDIDLWHSGSAIETGSKKWIGCEIIDVFTS